MASSPPNTETSLIGAVVPVTTKSAASTFCTSSLKVARKISASALVNSVSGAPAPSTRVNDRRVGASASMS